jgi:hypothetical protein
MKAETRRLNSIAVLPLASEAVEPELFFVGVVTGEILRHDQDLTRRARQTP